MRKYPDLYYIVKGKHNFYEGFKNRIGNLVNFVRCGHSNPAFVEYLRKSKIKEPLTFIQIRTFIDYEGTNEQYLNDIKIKGLYYNSDNTCTFGKGEIPILSFVYESGKYNSYINGINYDCNNE